MNDESFIHFGERLARELGGVFKIQGKQAILADKTGGSVSGQALSVVEAAWGDNLIDWDLAPRVGRPQFKKMVSRWFDVAKARWTNETENVEGGTADADYSDRFSRADKDEAKSSAKNDAKNSQKEKGGGSCSIDGTASAKPGGTCVVIGARAGIDGPYRMETVDHEIGRGGGWITKLTLKMPGDGTGSDSRKK